MKDELRTELAATQEAVEQFCWDLNSGGDDITSRDAFGTELLLREALVNTILHACQSKADHRGKCIVRGGRGRILILLRIPEEDSTCERSGIVGRSRRNAPAGSWKFIEVARSESGLTSREM